MSHGAEEPSSSETGGTSLRYDPISLSVSMAARPELSRLFVSSAFADMLDLRQRVAAVTVSLGFTPALTERFVAHGTAVAERMEREIARCDTYVRDR